MYNQPDIAIDTMLACRTNSLSIVIGICVGRAADQPFHQAASVLLSDQALPFFIFRSDVIFLLSLNFRSLLLSVTHCGNSLTSCPFLQ